jgi:hypothetical protein
VKIPPAPFAKGGGIWGFAKGGGILGFGKGGDILRLFSDRMPERIACRQVSENSRTFPPFEKGGAGGISIIAFYTLVMEKELIQFHHFSALLLSYCHKKQENLFAPLRLCAFARDFLVAPIRVSHFSHS